MKSLKSLVLMILVCAVACTESDSHNDCYVYYTHAPTVGEKVVIATKLENKQTKDGYYYSYEKIVPGGYRDITDHYEKGIILNLGTDKEELVVIGRYSVQLGPYETIVMYIADKNGYRPKVHTKLYPCYAAVSPTAKLLASLSG